MQKTLTMRSISIAVACSLSISAFANAATPNSFNVPAGELGAALKALAKQVDIELVYQPEQVKNIRTGGIQGTYSAQEAVSLLLKGTPLQVHTDSSGAMVISLPLAPVAKTTALNSDLTEATGAQLVQADSQGSSQSSRERLDSRSTIQEIVVTAQRREERLQDVPMSITALSAESIVRRGLVSREDFLRSIPGVNAVDQGPGQNAIVIRGAYGDPFGTGPTVGVYFGDVPLAGLALGASADIKLIDVARVEVLRGPQGTLYGSNSLSGTVRYIPNAPDLDEMEARLAMGYSVTSGNGDDNTLLEGVVNIPLAEDRLALRAVLYRHRSSGFIKNIARDDPILQRDAAAFGAEDLARGTEVVGDSSFTGGRAALLWQATERLALNLNYYHQDTDQDDRPFAQRGYARYQRSTYDLRPTLGADDAMRIRLDVGNLTGEYRTDVGTIVSSTSLIQQDFTRNWEIGSFFRVAGRAPPMPQTSLTRSELLTQEIRFASEFEGPFQMIAGLYYEDSEQPTDQAAFYAGNPAFNPIAPGISGEVYANYVDRQIEQEAVFGELSYKALERLKFTVGARGFQYDAAFTTDRNRSANLVTRPLTFETTSTSESGTIVRAGVEYVPRRDALIYANYSEGFRLGRPVATDLIRTACDLDQDGQLDGTDISSDFDLIASDRLATYEVGARAALFGGRARLSAAGYRNDWTDIPVVFRPPGCLINTTINAGEARAYGIELEGAIDVTSDVQVNVGVGYVNSELTTTTSLGAAGAQMNYSPELNGHLAVEYRFDVLGRDVWLRGDYTYFDEYFTGTGRTGTRFDAYDVIGLSAGVAIEKVKIRAFVRNLADTYAITSESTFPANGIYPIAPRTAGLQLDVSF